MGGGMWKNKQRFVVKFYIFRPPLLWGMPTAGVTTTIVRSGYAGTAYHTEYKTPFSELFFRILLGFSSKLLSR